MKKLSTLVLALVFAVAVMPLVSAQEANKEVKKDTTKTEAKIAPAKKEAAKPAKKEAKPAKAAKKEAAKPAAAKKEEKKADAAAK